MKKTLIFTFILLSSFGCGLRPMSGGSESESKMAEEGIDPDTEFEFAVDGQDSSSGPVGDEFITADSDVGTAVSVSDTGTSSKKDEFSAMEEEFMAKPSEPSFATFKVSNTKKEEIKKGKVKEIKIDTPITPLAVYEESKTAFIREESPASFDSEFSEYHVQKGDTLMMIGFKLFGDYRYWKELKKWNSIGTKDLVEGSVIKYRNLSDGQFKWNPKGLPHLVKRGEYLGSISMDKYGTSKKWKAIFENNRPFLRDPNLIFAGFTIYYVPDKRGVASEN